MSSFSQSTNSSSSSPVETTENGLIDQLSGVAAGLAQQMNQWAQQTFAQTSQVTDQTVNNFFQASQQMMGLAGNMTSQYNNLFAPENAQLVQDANDYASPEHMAVDMGSAGATQAQAGAAAIQNSEEDLVGMGIDPSSGRYAALDKAAAVQNAANIAGAENTQRNTDIATGQQLRAEAVQVGSELPSAISNATNTAIQANTGAENASLGNANTGANLQSLADKYLQTAMGIKLPLTASRSSGQSTGNSNKPEQSGSGGSGNGQGAGGGQGAASAAWMPAHGGAAASATSGGVGGGAKRATANGGDAATWNNIGQEFGGGVQGPNSPAAGTDFGQWTDPVYSPDANGSGSMDIGQAGSASDPTDFLDNNPFGDSGFGQTLDPTSALGGGQADQTFGNMGGGTDTQFGNISYDPSANQTSDYSGYGDYSQPDTSVYSSMDSGSTQAFQDYGYQAPDMSGGGYGDYTGGGSDDEGYAGGGAVAPAQTTGGAVSPSMSPSGGAQTDDVRANLNSGEFVVPKDVTRWKGEEFMHNLIAQSRQKRLKMQQALGTGGKPMPAGDPRAQQRPQFNSRPMGAR
jgi:hypothetical protein